MADLSTLANARLLVRPDLTAIRLDQALDRGARPARRPAGPAPELRSGEKLSAGVAYPNHSASGSWTYVPRWTFGDGEKFYLKIRYWGSSGAPPDARDELAVGEITGSLFAPAPPAASGPIDPVLLPPAEVQLVLRYSQRVEGQTGVIATERVLGRLRAPMMGEVAAKIDLPIRTQADAELIYGALTSGQDTVFVLRTEVTTWVRSWNQTLLGGKSGRPDSAVRLVSTRDFSALRINPAVVSAIRAESILRVRPPVPAPAPAPEPAPEPAPAPEPEPAVEAVPVIEPRLHLHPTVFGRGLDLGAALGRATPVAEAAPVAEPVAEPVVRATPLVNFATLRAAPAAPAEPAPAPAQPELTVTPSLLRMTAMPLARTVGASAVIDAGVASRLAGLKLEGRAVVPQEAVVDDDGQPAWVSVQTPVEWEIPAWFPLGGAHDAIYETGTIGQGGPPTLLQAVSGVTDTTGRTLTGVFREVVFPKHIHLVPQVFRLARARNPPCLPAMSFLASTFVAADEDGAEPVFRVAVAYELEPWLPPDIRESVARAVGVPAPELSFTVSPPVTASLRLVLPDGPSDRSAAVIDADARIRDTLDLSADSFARLIQSMVGNAAGITGTVTISLLDGQLTAESRVELGLGYESEYLLDTVVVGAGGTPGQWAVRLRNRIESPVRIEECRAFTLPTGVLAMPLAETVPVGTTLNPNQAVDVVYQLQPADAMLVAETLPVRATPIPDAAVLLGMLVLPGGGAATPSKVTVNARFPTTPDAEPIVGLKVEFDDESEVTLTPSSPSAEVTLAGRILDVALGRSPEFFYRVQNLHPTRGGAATGWTKAAVGVPLTISWVVATIAESF